MNELIKHDLISSCFSLLSSDWTRLPSYIVVPQPIKAGRIGPVASGRTKHPGIDSKVFIFSKFFCVEQERENWQTPEHVDKWFGGNTNEMISKIRFGQPSTTAPQGFQKGSPPNPPTGRLGLRDSFMTSVSL